MDRINKIMTTLIGQVDVLETMTPLDFFGLSQPPFASIWISVTSVQKIRSAVRIKNREKTSAWRMPLSRSI